MDSVLFYEDRFIQKDLKQIYLIWIKFIFKQFVMASCQRLKIKAHEARSI